MKFFEITSDYIAAAALTEAACLDTAWSEKQIAEAMSDSNTLYLAAVKDGVLCGIASCVFSKYEAMIENLAVLKEYRRLGVATQLLQIIEKEARNRNLEQLSLEVASRNLAAVALYERTGYKKVGVRKGFYSKQKDDALVMIKEIL